jgi:putative membrane protein insertion efficiency factor
LRACRFSPTCSEYSLQAFKRFGFWKAAALTLGRLFKCHPFTAGGYDPLPQTLGESWKKER